MKEQGTGDGRDGEEEEVLDRYEFVRQLSGLLRVSLSPLFRKNGGRKEEGRGGDASRES